MWTWCMDAAVLGKVTAHAYKCMETCITHEKESTLHLLVHSPDVHIGLEAAVSHRAGRNPTA